MSSFKVLFVCVQMCLLQVALSQVITYNPSLGGNIASFGVPDVAALAQLPVTGPYGATGTGEMSVAGEVQAYGQTVVAGQVPVIGSVSFSGAIPAYGVVSIAGNCGCI